MLMPPDELRVAAGLCLKDSGLGEQDDEIDEESMNFL